MSGGGFQNRMKLSEDVIGLRTLFMACAATAFVGNGLSLVFGRAVGVREIEEAPTTLEPAVFHRCFKHDGLPGGCSGSFKNKNCAFGKLSGFRKCTIRGAIQ